MKYYPYQIVELKAGGYAELMSFTFEGKIFARTVVGDPTSAVYLEESQLGKAVPVAACFVCKSNVPRAVTERVKRGDLFVTVCKSHQLEAK